jgi:hypothetical protein
VSAENQSSLPNCVVSSELVFTAEFVELATNQFRCRIVVSAANQVLLPNYGVSSESIFDAEVWCQQRISFRC